MYAKIEIEKSLQLKVFTFLCICKFSSFELSFNGLDISGIKFSSKDDILESIFNVYNAIQSQLYLPRVENKPVDFKEANVLVDSICLTALLYPFNSIYDVFCDGMETLRNLAFFGYEFLKITIDKKESESDRQRLYWAFSNSLVQTNENAAKIGTFPVTVTGVNDLCRKMESVQTCKPIINGLLKAIKNNFKNLGEEEEEEEEEEDDDSRGEGRRKKADKEEENVDD